MTVTYSPTLSLARDRIRFRLGDTDTGDALLQDEEISAFLTLNGSDEDAALLALAKGLISRYSRLPVSFTADGVTMNFGQRISSWREIAGSVDSSGSSIRIRTVKPSIANSGRTEFGG